MKILFISAFLFFSAGVFATPMATAMKWHCEGVDTDSERPVSFDLVLADHDGKDYTYKSLENFIYDGKPDDSIDLNKDKVICGKDDEGADRIGFQEWDLQDGRFTLFSGCENESLEIEATCSSF